MGTWYIKRIILILLCCVVVSCWGAERNLNYYISDVSQDHWAYPAVVNSIHLGLVRLGTDGKFHGNQMVTRYETISYLHNFSVAWEKRLNEMAMMRDEQAHPIVTKKMMEEFRAELDELRNELLFRKDITDPVGGDEGLQIGVTMMTEVGKEEVSSTINRYVMSRAAVSVGKNFDRVGFRFTLDSDYFSLGNDSFSQAVTSNLFHLSAWTRGKLLVPMTFRLGIGPSLHMSRRDQILMYESEFIDAPGDMIQWSIHFADPVTYRLSYEIVSENMTQERVSNYIQFSQGFWIFDAFRVYYESEHYTTTGNVESLKNIVGFMVTVAHSLSFWGDFGARVDDTGYFSKVGIGSDDVFGSGTSFSIEGTSIVEEYRNPAIREIPYRQLTVLDNAVPNSANAVSFMLAHNFGDVVEPSITYVVVTLENYDDQQKHLLFTLPYRLNPFTQLYVRYRKDFIRIDANEDDDEVGHYGLGVKVHL
ncbi:S-layer homology domain-containing protein [Candidatus Margulisiibacteriota bacterium]